MDNRCSRAAPLQDRCNGGAAGYLDAVSVPPDVMDLWSGRGIVSPCLQRSHKVIRRITLSLDHDPAAEVVRFAEMCVVGGTEGHTPARV